MEGACIEAKAKQYVLKEIDYYDEFLPDIQAKFGLKEVQSFSKAEFMTWVRGYLPKITARLKTDDPERVQLFKRGATQLVKLITDQYTKMQLFVGKNMDYQGAFCFAYKKDQEDEVPTFLFFADGLKEMIVY